MAADRKSDGNSGRSARRPESPERFVAAMARAATAVSVVTSDGPAGRLGLTVSAISAVSADPPLILACIKRRNPVSAAIETNAVLAINVLGEDQRYVADVFAGRTPDRQYDFGCAEWSRAITGSPLLFGAAAAFDCELDAIHEAGSHRILIGRVVEARCGDALPLVYARRGYRAIADRDL